jgi:hypothetical protein
MLKQTLPISAVLGALAVVALAPRALHAQSLDLGAGNVGVSIGNSPRWTGLRINVRDDGVQRVTGVNLTLWKPGENPDFRMNGLAIGVVGPAVGTLNGVGVGLLGVVAEQGINGIAVGGLGTVSQGHVRGVALAGLGTVAEGSVTGISVAGLGVVSQGDIAGISIAGLGAVAEGRMTGVRVAGLGVVSQGDMAGISVAGLGAVAQGNMSGVNVAGLGLVSQGGMSGINMGGLATIGQGGVTGVNAAGLAVIGEGGVQGINAAGLAVIGGGSVTGLTAALGVVEGGTAIRGVTAAGYRVRAPNVDGVAAAVAMMRTENLRGFSLAGYNEVRGVQTGLTIGIYNTAQVLNGVQIGVINHAGNNPPGLRWLPIVNANF